MLYQLRNGKTIEISIEQYLRMSDAELDAYTALGYGEEIRDPWTFSVLRYGHSKKELSIEDIPEESDLLSYEDETSIDKDDTYDDFIDIDGLEV